MTHLSEEQIRRFAFGAPDDAEDGRLADHLDGCPQCKARYVYLLMPSVRNETVLSESKKEELFEHIEQTAERRSSRFVLRRTTVRIAAGLALAACLALALLFVFDTSENAIQTPVAVDQHEKAIISDSLLMIADVNGGMTVNGETLTKPGRLPAAPLKIRTGQGESARLELVGTGSVEIMMNTNLSIAAYEPDTVTTSLAAGTIEANWDRSSGRELFVAVPGGLYHVVGTFFRISVDSTGSSIVVTKGSVAFRPIHENAEMDTVSAGHSRSYSYDGFPVVSYPGQKDSSSEMPDSKAVRRVGNRGANPNRWEPTQADTIDADEFFGEEENHTEEVGTVEYTAIQKAKALRQLGRPRESIKLLRPLVAAPKPPFRAYIGMGRAFEMMGEVDSAMHFYAFATSVRTPRTLRAVAWLLTGRLANNSGMFEKSAVAYKSYLRIATDGLHRDEAFEKLYRHYTREGNVDRQVKLLEKWINEAPELDYPVYLLATAYHTKGDFRYALRYYETYIMKYHEGAEREAAMYYAADCSRRLGEDEAYAKKARRYR
ncbi:MAG: hypothetical protein GF344_03455, partial [Chitinivibrionales bacterium]|nr:hypothetical protein [Chitinivibrionales bacterium]MBD3356128.1 hypothetical protein [Chitinivibrionales bacterium]